LAVMLLKHTIVADKFSIAYDQTKLTILISDCITYDTKVKVSVSHDTSHSNHFS
jgi:hypothetical protein